MKIESIIKKFEQGHVVALKVDHQKNEQYYLFQVGLPNSDFSSILDESKQLQLFTTTSLIENIISTDALKYGNIALPFQYSNEGVKSLIKHLETNSIKSLQGEQNIVVNSFPEGNVLELESISSYLAELVSLLNKEPNYVVCGFKNKQPENIDILTIDDLLESRISNPHLLSHTGLVETDLKYGDFEVHSFYSPIDHYYHWAFTTKDFSKQQDKAPLIRIESECLTGHVFGSLLCDCGEQMQKGLKKISEYGYGALIYLRQEGRGIGLIGKLKAYRLQQQEQMDTVDANLALGEEADARDYLIGAQVLNYFKKDKIKLLTNNPRKEDGLKKFNIEIEERVKHVIPPGKHNHKYLKTKADRLGHHM